MGEDPTFCENCGELDHDDIETEAAVPRLDGDTFEVTGDVADVYRCGGCGLVLGYDPVDPEAP